MPLSLSLPLSLYNNQNGATPEFFDDDIPLLYLGAETPAIYLDDGDVEDSNLPSVRKLYYGLLFAAGMKSDSGVGLKRSARHAMNLLKWLLIDWRDGTDTNHNTNNNNSSSSDSLNLFARAFLSLPVQYYKHLQLNLHVTGDDRGGAKEDACTIVVLLLCHHLQPESSQGGDGTGLLPQQPVLLEELVTTPVAQQAYDLWSARANLTAKQQELIKKNTLQRQAEIAMQQRQEALLQKKIGINTSALIHNAARDDLDMVLEDSEHQDASENNLDNNDDERDNHHRGGGGGEDDRSEDSEIDELDVMAAIRKRQKAIRKELALTSNSDGGGGGRHGHRSTVAAVRWEDSQLAREQAVRDRAAAAAAAAQQQNATTISNTVRDSADAAQEVQLREDEKAKVLGKDPLGILVNNHDEGEEQFDLRHLENAQAEQMELALHEAQEDIQKAESGNEEALKKAVLSKESLEQLIEKLGGLEAMENRNSKASILPTRSTFNPLLFLTLLHRKTSYKDLLASMERLSSTFCRLLFMFRRLFLYLEVCFICRWAFVTNVCLLSSLILVR